MRITAHNVDYGTVSAIKVLQSLPGNTPAEELRVYTEAGVWYVHKNKRWYREINDEMVYVHSQSVPVQVNKALEQYRRFGTCVKPEMRDGKFK